MGQLNEETGIVNLAHTIAGDLLKPIGLERLRKILVDLIVNPEIADHLTSEAKDKLKSQFESNSLPFPECLNT